MSRLRGGVIVAALVLGAGCASTSGDTEETQSRRQPLPERHGIDWRTIEQPGGDRTNRGPEDGQASADGPSLESQLFLGTGEFIDPEADREAVVRETDSGDLTLNFEGADLREVALTILGEVLEENVTIHPRVSGTVTFETSRPLKRETVLPVLDSVLRAHGATFVEKEGHYQVLPLSEAEREGGEISIGRIPADSAGQGILVVPLRFATVPEMRDILDPVLPGGAILHTDTGRNLLLLAGTPPVLGRAREMVDMFDVDWMEGMSLGLVPVEHGDVEEIVDQLAFIFHGDQEDGAEDLVRMLPLVRLNAVLAISQQPAYVRRVREWTRRLDRPSEQEGRSLHVYYVENNRAADLAEVLNSVFTGGAPSPQRTSSRRDGATAGGRLAPGMTPGVIETEDGLGDAEESGSADSPSERNAPRSGYEAGPTPSLGGDDEVRIIAQPNSNALLILANESEYRAIEDAIRRLDEPPLQVLVDATIVEVTLTDELSYGLQWFFSTRTGEFTGEGTVGGELDFSSTFDFTLSSQGQVRALLQALSRETELRVLSAPSLMVLNNRAAEINVGDQIPLVTQRATGIESVDAPTLQQIEMRDTGVLLELTPRVNSGGLVTMEIRQEVSDPGEFDETGSRSILQRQIASTVAVQSGNTVVLGGLMRENQSVDQSGVPGLRELPLLGGLFGQTTRTTRTTELLVLITPRVIDNRAKQQAVVEEFRQKLEGLRRFDWNRVTPFGQPEPVEDRGESERP